MDLVIIGGGRHAQVVRSCLDAVGNRIIGIVDDRLPAGTMAEDLTVLGPLDALPDLRSQHLALGGVIAVGDNHARRQITERVEAMLPGFRWVAAIHPSAIIAPTARIAAGTVVVAGAIINCHAVIGRHALINTGSIIDHDTVMGEFASTGPGVVTGGNVVIGKDSHIGLGAVIAHGVAIGAGSIIGGNAYVCRDVPDHVVSYGSPARIIRSRSDGERYL